VELRIEASGIAKDEPYEFDTNFGATTQLGGYPREKFSKIFSGNDSSRGKNMRGI
jgi:hypothetical protein